MSETSVCFFEEGNVSLLQLRSQDQCYMSLTSVCCCTVGVMVK